MIYDEYPVTFVFRIPHERGWNIIADFCKSTFARQRGIRFNSYVSRGVLSSEIIVEGKAFKVEEGIQTLHALGVLDKVKLVHYKGNILYNAHPETRMQAALKAAIEGRLGKEEMRYDEEKHGYLLRRVEQVVDKVRDVPIRDILSTAIWIQRRIDERPIPVDFFQMELNKMNHLLKERGVDVEV